MPKERVGSILLGEAKSSAQCCYSLKMKHYTDKRFHYQDRAYIKLTNSRRHTQTGCEELCHGGRGALLAPTGASQWIRELCTALLKGGATNERVKAGICLLLISCGALLYIVLLYMLPCTCCWSPVRNQHHFAVAEVQTRPQTRFARDYPELASLPEQTAIRQSLLAIPEAKVELTAVNRYFLNRLRRQRDAALWMFDRNEAASIMNMVRYSALCMLY